MLDAEPAQCPPTKRRKVEPKPRTTKHLDLTPGSHRDHPALDLLVKTLQKKKKIVVVAGAGISVSAGS
jgi:NAD-dependent histone deacetylase SIR2